MKKIINITITITIIILAIILIDLIFIYKNNKPLIILKEDNNKYTGIFYNTYKCLNNKKVIIKNKFTTYNCKSITTTNIDMNNITVKVNNDSNNITTLKGIVNFKQTNEYSLYYYGINNITINEEELSTLLLNGTIKIDDIISKMNIITNNDNGILYEYPDNIFRMYSCKVNDIKRIYILNNNQETFHCN